MAYGRFKTGRILANLQYEPPEGIDGEVVGMRFVLRTPSTLDPFGSIAVIAHCHGVEDDGRDVDGV